MDYIVSSSFRLDASQAIKQLESLERIMMQVDKTFQEFTKIATSATNALTAFTLVADKAGLAAMEFRKGLQGIPLGNFSSRLGTASSAMSNLGTTTLKTTFTLADQATELNALNRQALTAATSVRQLGTAMRGVKPIMAGGTAGGGSRSLREAEKVGMLGSIAAFGNKALMAGMTATIGYDLTKQTLGDFIVPGIEYQQAVYKLKRMGGVSPGELADVEKTARLTSQQVPTSTLTENVRNIQELYSIMGPGRMNEAKELAPFGAKLDLAMKTYLTEHPGSSASTEGLLQTVAKTAEQVGRFRTPAEAEKFMTNVFRQTVSTGGMSTPQIYAQVVKFMRGARFGKTDEFMFGALPFLIQEMANKGGGGSRGVGPMMTAFDRLTSAGKIDKLTMNQFQQLGLLPHSMVENQHFVKSSTGYALKPGVLKGYDLALTDPFAWHQQVAMPAILAKAMPGVPFKEAQKRFDTMDQGERKKLMAPVTAGMNNTLADFFQQFAMNEALVEKHIELFKSVGDLQEQYNMAMETTIGKTERLNASFNNLATLIGKSDAVVKPLNAGLDTLSNFFSGLPKAFGSLPSDFPNLAKDLQAIGGAFKWLGDQLSPVISALPEAVHLLLQVLDKIAGFANGVSTSPAAQGMMSGSEQGGAIGQQLLGPAGKLPGEIVGGAVGALSGGHNNIGRRMWRPLQHQLERIARDAQHGGLSPSFVPKPPNTPAFVPPAGDMPHIDPSLLHNWPVPPVPGTPGWKGYVKANSPPAPTVEHHHHHHETKVYIDGKEVAHYTQHHTARSLERGQMRQNATQQRANSATTSMWTTAK